MQPLDQLEIGERIRKSLEFVAKILHNGILLGIHKFLTTSTEYLMKNLPRLNTILKDIHCLDVAAGTKVGC
jgi:hypothetical protein